MVFGAMFNFISKLSSRERLADRGIWPAVLNGLMTCCDRSQIPRVVILPSE